MMVEFWSFNRENGNNREFGLIIVADFRISIYVITMMAIHE
tara:strand:+ start:55 stop:177 length:123 start_codon:yes stop_codon:yes gene_type:complete